MFSVEEMVAAFDVADVNASPARFDATKAEAINAAHLRLLAPGGLPQRLVPYLQAGGVLPAEPSAEQLERLAAAAPLVQERMTLLGQAPGMLGFLFVADEDVVLEAEATAALRPEAADVLDASLTALEALAGWAHRRPGGRAAGRRGGGAGDQAQVRLRPAAHGRHRAAGLAAAVRVDGDPRPGVLAGPAAAAARHALTGDRRPPTAQVVRRGADLGCGPQTRLEFISFGRFAGRISHHGVWCNWQHDCFWYS